MSGPDAGESWDAALFGTTGAAQAFGTEPFGAAPFGAAAAAALNGGEGDAGGAEVPGPNAFGVEGIGIGRADPFAGCAALTTVFGIAAFDTCFTGACCAGACCAGACGTGGIEVVGAIGTPVGRASAIVSPPCEGGDANIAGGIGIGGDDTLGPVITEDA